jgi:esterase/lipase
MHSSLNIIAAVGLALGGALGLAGTLATRQDVQAILWAIDELGS